MTHSSDQASLEANLARAHKIVYQARELAVLMGKDGLDVDLQWMAESLESALVSELSRGGRLKTRPNV